MTDFITLVNNCILEAGVDLDEMTSSPDTFSTPTDPMQKRFKRWVIQAWREIQLERNEWQFKSKQGQTEIYPRFLVVDGDRATTPAATYTYEGDTTGTTFEVVSVTLISGAWASGTAVAWIDYTDLSGFPMWNEQFDETDPSVSELNVFRTKWFGRYNLNSTFSDMLEANVDSFYIQSPAGISVTDDVNSSDNRKLTFIPYDSWNAQGLETDKSMSMPSSFTITPDGYYDFWPRLNQPYILTLTYTAEPQELSAYGDTPTDFPSEYHDMILWRALMYYADYDSKPQIFARAERRYESYKNRLERNQMPIIGWSLCKYDSISYSR